MILMTRSESGFEGNLATSSSIRSHNCYPATDRPSQTDSFHVPHSHSISVEMLIFRLQTEFPFWDQSLDFFLQFNDGLLFRFANFSINFSPLACLLATKHR